MNAEQDFEGSRIGWEMTSEQGRGEILHNIVVSIGDPQRSEIGGVALDTLSRVEEYQELPQTLKGYLLTAFTPDGWDYSSLKRISEIASRTEK